MPGEFPKRIEEPSFRHRAPLALLDSSSVAPVAYARFENPYDSYSDLGTRDGILKLYTICIVLENFSPLA